MLGKGQEKVKMALPMKTRSERERVPNEAMASTEEQSDAEHYLTLD